MLGMIKMTYTEIRAAILAVDDETLEENLLVQFLNYVPTGEEIKSLEPFKDEQDKLAASDQFFWVVWPSRTLSCRSFGRHGLARTCCVDHG